MRFVILSVLLASIWMLLFGKLTASYALIGLAVGVAVTGFARWTIAREHLEERGVRSIPGPVRILRGAFGAARLLAFFLKELTKANLELSRDVLRPDPPFQPGFVAFDVPELRPGEAVLMAAMISLTPGTITVDIEPDASTLYVHSIYAGDLGAMTAALRRYVELIVAARGDRASEVGR